MRTMPLDKGPFDVVRGQFAIAVAWRLEEPNGRSEGNVSFSYCVKLAG